MGVVVSTTRAELIPQATTALPTNAAGEAPVSPAVTAIPTNGSTVPIITNHCEAVRIWVDASNAAGTAEIYSRANDDAAWGLLDTLDISSGNPKSLRYECPVGQLAVKVLVAATATVYAQGILSNRG